MTGVFRAPLPDDRVGQGAGPDVLCALVEKRERDEKIQFQCNRYYDVSQDVPLANQY